MALSYLLELSTPASLDDVASRLRALLGAAPGAGAKFDVPAMNVAVREPSESSRDVALEVWRIEPTLRASFYVHSNAPDEDYEAARRGLSLASADLVAELDAEAVLHFQGDRALLRRTEGILYLYDWWPEWTADQVVPNLPQPFEMIHGNGVPD